VTPKRRGDPGGSPSLRLVGCLHQYRARHRLAPTGPGNVILFIVLGAPAHSISLLKTPRKILIVKPSSLGDVVHSLPFLNAVKLSFPNSEIHWVIAKGLEGLLDGNPMINRLIVINKDVWKKISRTVDTLVEVRRLFKKIREERYDLVVDLQGLLRSGLITMASRAPARIGFTEAREGSTFFYTAKVRGGKDLHAVDRYLKIAAALGCEADGSAFPLPLIKESDSWVKAFKSDLKEYIVLVPGARWATKIWPAENFGKVASLVQVPSLVVGSRADRGIADKVVEASRGRAVSVAGKTSLMELIEIMRGAKLVISNDSGPMHIAAALGVPVVAIFGPTSPERTGPYGGPHVIVRSGAACAPCFKKKCRDMKCMKEVTPEEVGKRVKESLVTRE
jgi:heptosyltransferase-1